jgi:uncharacterized membrane protein YraQ (UPF0718 family)
MTFDMFADWVGRLLWSGWTGLLDYLAAHVLLCLVPAFIIAGYMSAMIPKEAIIRFLGPKAPKWISYPASAAAGFILAVCSCTILPLFAGIWKRGAGLGPAITFLFVGPAVNILAIAYTGAAIGLDIALARIALSIVFGMGIGMIMAWLFRQEEARRADTLLKNSPFERTVRVKPAVWLMFGLLLALLITGTLQIPLLTGEWLSFHLPLDIPPSWLAMLEQANLTPQGGLLIFLLLLTAPVAARGLNHVLEQLNRWTYLTVGMVAFTLLAAAPSVTAGSLVVGITGRFVGELTLVLAVGWVAARHFERNELAGWLWETWKFVKQIFPLLIIGVFAAGVVKEVLPEAWIQSLAGRNTIWANLVGVLFGVFMYFPTLVEVPIARMFLDLGMHRGPLLAYLLADPELSLQSILVTGKILGRDKTIAYVALVTLFSTLAGYLFGLALAIF